jgi:hypothetical protein
MFTGLPKIVNIIKMDAITLVREEANSTTPFAFTYQTPDGQVSTVELLLAPMSPKVVALTWKNPWFPGAEWTPTRLNGYDLTNEIEMANDEGYRCVFYLYTAEMANTEKSEYIIQKISYWVPDNSDVREYYGVEAHRVDTPQAVDEVSDEDEGSDEEDSEAEESEYEEESEDPVVTIDDLLDMPLRDVLKLLVAKL